MHIFRGKLDFFDYAENEGITLIVPKLFQTGEPVYISWKWTKIPSACSNPHFFDVGTFAVESINGRAKTKISFLHSNYYFEAIFGHDFKSLVLIAKLIDGRVQDPIVLSLVYNTGDLSTGPRFFVGSFSCPDSKSELALGDQVSAVDEMFLLVAPHGFTHYQPVLALSQLTVDDHDRCTVKTNIDCHDQIQSVDEMLKFTFRHGGDYFFEGELSRDGKQVTATVKSSKHEWSSDFVLEEIQPAARSSVFDNVTSTIKNDSTEIVHCTLMQADGDSTHDWAWNLASLVISLAGVPGLSLSIEAVKKMRKLKTLFEAAGVVSTVGGVVTGTLSVKDLSESDTAVVSKTLTPGDSITRKAVDNKNSVKLIRSYVFVEGENASIKVDSIEKQLEISGTTLVKDLLADMTATTTNLLQFALPSKNYTRSDTLFIAFPNIMPGPEHVGTVLDKFPNQIDADKVLTAPVGAYPDKPDITVKSFKTLTNIISDTSIGFSVLERDSHYNIHYSPITTSITTLDPSVKLLSLLDGRPVLKLEGCFAIDPVVRPPDKDIKIGTEDPASDDIALRLIKDNPLTQEPVEYYWAYSPFKAATPEPSVTRLIGVKGISSYLKRENGRITYIVASSGPLIFRNMAEVTG